MLLYGEFAPDQADFGGSNVLEAKNVIPMSDHYRPLNGFFALSDALPAKPLGSFSINNKAGEMQIFSGTESQLFQLNGNSSPSFNDVSNGTYATADDGRWDFTSFGNFVLATNYEDPIQSFDIESGSAFEDLSADAPKAKCLAIVNNFVVTGYTNDGTDGEQPRRVRWSGIDDANSWEISPTTQADFQDLQGNGGSIQRIIGGDYGVIFQEQSIWRMSYIGAPLVFQFEEMEKNRGTVSPASVVQVGSNIFYLAQDGFYVFDGQNSHPIGAGKVNQYFLNDIDMTELPRLSAAVDPVNQLIFWSYPGAGNVNGLPNKVLIYSWVLDRWSRAEIDTELMTSGMSLGYSLEDLDGFSTSLDGLPFSLDSKVWSGGNPVLAAYDSSYRLGFFNGDEMPATITTADFAGTDGARITLTNVIPLIDGGTTTVNIGSRDARAAAVTWSGDIPLNALGEAPVRINARFQRVRADISGHWTKAQSVAVEYIDSGAR